MAMNGFSKFLRRKNHQPIIVQFILSPFLTSTSASFLYFNSAFSVLNIKSFLPSPDVLFLHQPPFLFLYLQK